MKMRIGGAMIVVLLLAPGCSESNKSSPEPNSANFWIAKLDEPGEYKVAVCGLALMRAGAQQAAIEPLSKVWKERGRPIETLDLIIDIARNDVNGPHWQLATPVLRIAVSEMDLQDPESVESGLKAIRALGQSGDTDNVPTLLEVLRIPMTDRNKPAFTRIRMSVLWALGDLGSDQRAQDALLLELSYEPEEQPLGFIVAALIGLSKTPTPQGTESIIRTMFLVPATLSTCSRALVRIGEPAFLRLLQVFQRKDPILEELVASESFVNCGKDGGLQDCLTPSSLEHRSALVLGDFHDARAVPVLLNRLKRRDVPASHNGIVWDSPHLAILQALASIGDPAAAPPCGNT